MIDEIDDFMVEHPIFITSPNQLITNHILRPEALKLAFRDMTHGQTNTHFETVMLKLNSYIINAKEQIRAQQEISNLRNLMEQTQDQRELISLLEQIDQLQTNQSNVSAFQSHPLQMCKTTPIPKIEFNEDISSQQLQLELTSIQPIQTNTPVDSDFSESIVSGFYHSSPSARQSILLVSQVTCAPIKISSKHLKLLNSKKPKIIWYRFMKKTSRDTRRKHSSRLHQTVWYYVPKLVKSSVKCLLNPCQVLLVHLLGMLSLCFLDIFNLVLPFKHSKLPGLLNGNSILLFFEHSFMTFGHSSMVTWFQFHFIFISFQF